MKNWEETSPTPWDPSDKHAFLSYANGVCIATFGDGGKGFHDLNNRNRAAQAVNALSDIESLDYFGYAFKRFMDGTIPEEVFRAAVQGKREFKALGIVIKFPSVNVPELHTLAGAIRRHSYARTPDPRTLVHVPSGFKWTL